MKTFKQFQEKLTHIGVTLKKIKKDIESQPGDKPYIQEPGKPLKRYENFHIYNITFNNLSCYLFYYHLHQKSLVMQ